MKRKKYGFSFIELILILVFFFLILAALMPMITRRHLAPPTRATHGTYACYWDKQENGDQVLKETLVKGKKTLIDNEPAEGGQCRFESPRRAKYFYVQIIGGGGGGRDLDWETEVNPENVNNEKYRVRGEKEMTKDDEGYFVSGEGYKPHNIPLSKEQYNKLLEPDMICVFGYCEATTSNHVMFLHGTSGAGGTCTENLNYTDYPYCEVGEKLNSAFCEAKVDSKCTELKDCEDCSYQSYDKTYWYECVDDDGNGDCDNHAECTGRTVTCVTGTGEEAVESALEFKPMSDISTASCEGGKSGEGISYYRGIGVGGFLSQGSDIFSIHKGNHDTLCRYADSYELTASDYNLYKGDTWRKPFKYDKVSLAKMSRGSGIWFGGRYIDDFVPLYVCGGGGAERGVKLSSNPRSNPSASGSAFCSPAYGDPDMPGKWTSGTCKGYERNGLTSCQFGSFGILTGMLYGDYDGTKEPAVMKDPSNKWFHDYQTFRLIYINLWQHQEIPYGVGGRAGELKTLILKTIPDGIYMMPGKGGEGGIDPQKGEETVFGSDDEGSEISKKVALGGDVGSEIFSIDAGIGPYKTEPNLQSPENGYRTATTVDVDSRYGGTISYATFVKFIISYSNKELKQRMEVFGRGGDGAATATQATCGYKYFAYALYDSNKDPAVINSIPQPGQPTINAGTFMGGCNGYAWKKIPKPDGTKDKDYDEKNDNTNGFYWGYYANGPNMSDHAMQIVEHAQDGQTGAIVISW